MFREKRTLLLEPDKLKGQIIRISKVDFRENEVQKEMGVEDDVVIGFVVEVNPKQLEYLHRVRQLQNKFRYESEDDENFVPEDYMYEVVTHRGTLSAEDIFHEINTENSVKNVFWEVEVVVVT